jgi:hypothetical protein
VSIIYCLIEYGNQIEIDISHGVLSISSPGSTVFPGDSAASVGIARLLNEWLATVRFSPHDLRAGANLI